MAPDPRVQHLLRRAGFGASAAEAAMFSERGFTATLDALVDYHRAPDDVDALIGQPGYAAVTPSAGAMEPFSPSTSINDARQRWLFRMVHTRRPLQEKMALFWHQHFATAYSKIANAVGGVGATQMMAAKRSEHPAGLWGQLRAVPRLRAAELSRSARRSGERSRPCCTGSTAVSILERARRRTSRAR